jgi:hypothetical protein
VIKRKDCNVIEKDKNNDSMAAIVAANMARKNVKSLNHTVITHVSKD